MFYNFSENTLNYLKGTYIIESFIISIPFYLLIFEIKKFNKNLTNFQNLIEDIKLNISDVSESSLQKYPFINDIQILTKKINKILS